MRPAGQAAAPGVLSGPGMNGTASPPGAEPTDRETLLRFLTTIPRDDTARIVAAGAGYCLGLIDGRAEVYAEIAHAGEDVIASPEWKKVVRQPTDHELARRRGEHMPCFRDCGTCTQCRRSKRWWAQERGYTVTDHDEVLEIAERIGRGSGRRVVLTPASDIHIRPVRWLWADRLPIGALCISAGRVGVAKSQHAVWLAAQLTRGTLPGIHYGAPRAVIYAATEDSWEMTIAPRLAVADADMTRVYRIDVRADDDEHATLTLPVDTEQLAQAICDHGVALIVLDPLLSTIDAGINDYRQREVPSALEPIVAVADQTRCTVLGIAHFTKAAGPDPLLLISGSVGFGALIRAGLGFAHDDDSGDYVLSTIKNNLGREDLRSLAYSIEPVEIDTDEGPSQVSRFVLGVESDRHVRDMLRDQSAKSRPADDDDQGDQWLADLLAAGRVESNEVYKHADAAGYSKDQAKRAKARIGAVATHPVIPGPWYWELPQGSAKGVNGALPEEGALSLLGCSLGRRRRRRRARLGR